MRVICVERINDLTIYPCNNDTSKYFSMFINPRKGDTIKPSPFIIYAQLKPNNFEIPIQKN